MSELEVFAVVKNEFKGKTRICQSCAKAVGRYDEWKANHSMRDHASSIRCEVCGKTSFTVNMVILG